MVIENSRWISKLESDLDKREIFCLYGNIDDDFFYNRNIVNLENYLRKRFGTDVEYFFNTENFEEILEKINDEENKDPTGERGIDFFKFVNKIKESSEKYIVIKDPKLFFGDLCSGTTSYSLRYFLENIASNGFEDKKIIFISEELGDFPEKLVVNNPYTSTLYIDYPEEDERRGYLENLLKENRNILKKNSNIEYLEEMDIFVKLTSKRKLKDIKNIIKKAKSLDEEELEEKGVKGIINYYDFGEKESPWTKLKPSTIRNLEKKLKERVKGQDEAIEFVKKVVYRAKLNLNGIMQKYSTKPMGVMFFTGPSGVGKTELAKALTECIFGDESAFKRFDMSEYKSEESINKLIGSDPGYVGYNEGGQLTNWVMQNPYSVILFDEIDKANVKIWDTFLQVLEDGRLTDNKGNTVYFSETIIIFTSNIGNKEYTEDIQNPKEHYLNALNNYFEEKVGRVELLNRFGENKIVFNHISENIFKEIVKNKLDITVANIEKRIPNIKFRFENRKRIEEILFSKMGDSKKFGARLINSILENLFINEFAIFYMENIGEDQEEIIIIKEEGEKIKFEC